MGCRGQFGPQAEFSGWNTEDYDPVVDEDLINFVMSKQIPGTKEKQVLWLLRYNIMTVILQAFIQTCFCIILY